MMNVLLPGLLERLVTQLNIAHAWVLVHTRKHTHILLIIFRDRMQGPGLGEAGVLGGDYPIHRNERITQ